MLRFGRTAIVLTALAIPAAAIDNDTCVAATPIGGVGAFAFDLTDATASTPPEFLSCAVSEADAWYDWLAPADGVVLVNTCGQTDVDTVISVYRGECPGDGEVPIACSDNACQFQSQAFFLAVSGQTYRIRIAAAYLVDGGFGDFTIRYAVLPPNSDSAAPETIPCNTPLLVDHGHAIDDPNRPALDRLHYTFTKQPGPANLYIRGVVEPSVTANAPIVESSGAVKRYRFTGSAGDTISFRTEAEFEFASVYELYLDCAGAVLPDPPPCALPAAGCQYVSAQAGFASNNVEFVTAEEIRPALGGQIDGLCFRGGYADDRQADCFPLAQADDFEINYYADDGGAPGALLAGFSQAMGTLTIDARDPTGRYVADAITEYEYNAAHAAFAVPGGVCTWVEIVNNGTPCAWYWSAGGRDDDARLAQDSTPGDGPADADLRTYRLHLCTSVTFERDAACAPVDPPPPSPCALADTLCQPLDPAGVGALSTTATIAADDFLPDADGALAVLCWWGQAADAASDPADGFVVSYHFSQAGRPGATAAGPFRVSDGTLTVEAAPTGDRAQGAWPRYVYSGSHAPVPLKGGTRYWVAIYNEATDRWRWSFAGRDAGNGIARVGAAGHTRGATQDDFAVCLGLAFQPPAPAGPVPPNDDPNDAIPVTLPLDLTVDTRFATVDPIAAELDADAWQGLVWYRFTATQPNLYLSLQGTAYGVPGALVYLDRTTLRDRARLDGGATTVPLQAGEAYVIGIGAITSEGTAPIRLYLEEFSGTAVAPPANNDCLAAVPLAAGQTLSGSTFKATPSHDYAVVNGARVSAPGVWYRAAGTGGVLTASLCSVDTDFDTRLSVFEGSCDTTALPVAAADDTCGQASAVSWLSQSGVDYYLMVHGARGVVGNFAVTLCDGGAGSGDCDADGVDDACAIQTGVADDINGDGVPDNCQCLADVDGSGGVGFDDLLEVLRLFGAPGGPDQPADIDQDGAVDLDDLLTVLRTFGQLCP